jgi:uncharacterized membrane protein YeaQ/YmgE (transglycosylase-associated protein family)
MGVAGVDPNGSSGGGDRGKVLENGRKRMHVIWMLITGLIVGALAKLVMPGRDPGGIIVTMLIGLCGAIIAGFIGRMLGLYEHGQGAGFIMSTLGAIVLLVLYRLVTHRHSSV